MRKILRPFWLGFLMVEMMPLGDRMNPARREEFLLQSKEQASIYL